MEILTKESHIQIAPTIRQLDLMESVELPGTKVSVVRTVACLEGGRTGKKFSVAELSNGSRVTRIL